MSSPARDQVTVIIPARWGSTRFPGKVLASDTGMPMIRHVFERARAAGSVSRVVIATDDQRICDAVRPCGCEVVMTRSDHLNGTSRLAEASSILGLGPQHVIVNVQGDEPEIDPDVIDAVAQALSESGADMATVASPFTGDESPDDPNIVKVICTLTGRALYFSRSPIPFPREPGGPPPMKHVGIYAYRKSFLDVYAALEPTPLERTEALEQLRALEHGYSIAVAIRVVSHHGIDTPEQYQAFVARTCSPKSQSPH